MTTPKILQDAPHNVAGSKGEAVVGLSVAALRQGHGRKHFASAKGLGLVDLRVVDVFFGEKIEEILAKVG